MKEKNQDDILYLSENRLAKSKDETPVPSSENMKTANSINPKHLTYNKLIGRRGKYNKNELLISSEKDASFTIICEKPVVHGEENESNGKCCGSDCFGIFRSSGSSNVDNLSSNTCLSIVWFVIFVIMLLFPPAGLLLFLIFYLCTKNNQNMWR